MTRQYMMYVGLAVWALLMYFLLVFGARRGDILLPIFAVLLSSPLLLAYLGTSRFFEGRRLSELISLTKGSWSFLIGDTFVLTTAAALAAVAWRSIPGNAWYDSWWWTVACAAVGLGFGTLFHWWDSGNYRNYAGGDASALLLSPTKIAHDFVAYPVISGALLCVGIPLLVHWSEYTWGVLGCIAFWGVLVLCDIYRGLVLFNLHPGWDATLFEVIPRHLLGK